MLPVWGCYFIPGSICFCDDLHQGGILIGGEHLVLPARAVPQVQRPASGFRAGKVRMNPPDLRPVIVARRCEADAGRHGGGHRSAEDAALHEPPPLSLRVNRMCQLQLIFSVQCFRYLGGQGSENPIAVGREVCTVGWINTDQWDSPPRGQNENAAHVDDANGFPWKIELSQ